MLHDDSSLISISKCRRPRPRPPDARARQLYVADASLFVSSTAVNPSLAIIANALRVADRIAEHLGVRAGEPVALAS